MNEEPTDAGAAADGKAEAIPPFVYEELRRLAARYLGDRQWTVQYTALVHEAYLRCANLRCAKRGSFRSRAHFVAVAATAMRQILIDHARARAADRRDAGRRTCLDVVELAERPIDQLGFDDALQILEQLDQCKTRVVELRTFGGLTIEETASALEFSHMTVSNDRRFVRAWLAERIAW